jgi:Acetyltransferase (GNAT) domain
MTITQAGSAPLVLGYDPSQDRCWDELVARSCNGTFLHSRQFISYHKDRFADCSLLLQNRHGQTVGVFPAAHDPQDPATIVSHPGLTYGGLVHDDSMRGETMISALGSVADRYRKLGYRQLRYKTVPAIYHSQPAEDDRYALFDMGARRYRSDLSAVIDLSDRGRVSERRKRSLARAESAGVSTGDDWASIDGFWHALEMNLGQRHGVAPVHTLAEIRQLHDRFPAEISLITARIGPELVGGTVLFATRRVLHMQYLASTPHGRETNASDSVLEHAIGLGKERGYRFFDFGTCTTNQGKELDQGLYQFKISFGAGGVSYDHYELDLG